MANKNKMKRVQEVDTFSTKQNRSMSAVFHMSKHL